jgi:hypothetical protein
MQPRTDLRSLALDPRHGLVNALPQSVNDCGGFIPDLVQCYSNCGDDRKEVMAYYPLDFLSVMYTPVKTQ